jgi:hypothetical protein
MLIGAWTLVSVDGNANEKRRPIADLGLEGQLPTVLVDDHTASEGQPLARSFTDFLGGEEGLENWSSNRLWDRAPDIADGNAQRSPRD